MGVLSGSSLISSAVSGLTNAYGILASQNTDGTGLKVNNLTNLSTTVINQLGGNNNSFVSYLTSNFGNMDKNNDGVISSDELSKATTNMQSQGLTKEQITNLCANMSGTNSYSMVLEYFDQIDANNDGKVTDAEIKAYSYKAQRQKLHTELKGVKASNMSVYYTDESSYNEKPTSIVDNMYPDT
ncbi:MAG: hypothetical protein K6C94_06515 [Candidatus Gastranaerophilales bacterium]|nr:hypothetical protein [Candidatus Gastranaerophilales bacterium]